MNSHLQILEIKPQDLVAVAEVHSKAFSGSSLSRLGVEATRRFYEWQLRGPHAHRFIGAFEGTCLRGYAVGGRSRGALSGFVRRNWFYLSWRTFLRLQIIADSRSRQAIKAGLQGLLRSFKKVNLQRKQHDSTTSFDLLALAVDPCCQRLGVGGLLMEKMDHLALTNGYSCMKLTVRPENTKAIRFYEKLGWSKSVHNSVWDGGMVKLLDAANSSRPVTFAQQENL